MSEFKCPKCNALPHQCGKGQCIQPESRLLFQVVLKRNCEGLICECDDSIDTPDSLIIRDDHGESESNPCLEAYCFHCGWSGRLPLKSDTKSWPRWAKTALNEGWKPPIDWQPKEK